ncbi:VOC family protein [Microbulbifer agarilyticus]
MFTSFVPTTNIEMSKNFYGKKLGFSEDMYGFKPNLSGYEEVRIRPQVGVEMPSESYCYFRYEISDNFLTYCKELMENGVTFRVIAMTPGGYSGIMVDPDGNEILVECESFDNDDDSIDPNDWSCYQRY